MEATSTLPGSGTRRYRRGAALALAAALLTGAVLAPSAFAGYPCAGAEATPNDSSTELLAHGTVCLVNVERRRLGLRPLRVDRRLNRAAFDKGGDMIRRRYFGHDQTPTARIAATGYLNNSRDWLVGENLAWGWGQRSTPAFVVQGWMQSRTHRANLLRRRFREIGLSVFNLLPSGDAGATYTAEFGSRR